MEFLVFGEDWGRHPSSSQHILTALMDRYNVMWINSIGLRQPKLNWRDINRIGEKLLSNLCHRSMADPDITKKPTHSRTPAAIIRPLVWPVAQTPITQKINSMLLSLQLSRKQKRRIIWQLCPLPWTTWISAIAISLSITVVMISPRLLVLTTVMSHRQKRSSPAGLTSSWPVAQPYNKNFQLVKLGCSRMGSHYRNLQNLRHVLLKSTPRVRVLASMAA